MQSKNKYPVDAATVLRAEGLAAVTASVQSAPVKFKNTDPYWNAVPAFAEMDVVIEVETSDVDLKFTVVPGTVDGAGAFTAINTIKTSVTWKVGSTNKQVVVEVDTHNFTVGAPAATHFVLNGDPVTVSTGFAFNARLAPCPSC